MASRKGGRFLTDARLGEKSDAFTTCRVLKHAWDPIGGGDRRPEFGTLTCLRCVRCGTLRYDKFSRVTGERLAPPNYVWPDGYRDADRHDSSWWRQQWAENLFDRGLSVDAPPPERKKRA